MPRASSGIFRERSGRPLFRHPSVPPALVAVVLSAALAAGCAGNGVPEAQITEPPPTTTEETTEATTTEPTTTEPAVEPLSNVERAWANAIRKIRPRIDTTFEQSLTITRAAMKSLVRVLHTCRAKLEKAGAASERFLEPERIAKKACDRYEAAARQLGRAISVSDVGGATVAGSPEQAVFDKALSRAFAARGNGSNLMARAEAAAIRIMDEIEAEAGS